MGALFAVEVVAWGDAFGDRRAQHVAVDLLLALFGALGSLAGGQVVGQPLGTARWW